jgi:hypothetical protein
MSRHPRHQSVISRQSDAPDSDDHWLREFENKLQKTSVQPRGNSLFEQINTIMNGKSKYPSVQAAVDDMMQRSGLTDYLQTKTSSDKEDLTKKSKKTAQTTTEQKVDDNDAKMPQVIKEKRSILRTLENIIKETKGNLPVPTVISRLRALHAGDVSDNGAWEDERLIRLVSNYNLKAKKDNPGSYDRYDNLGTGDHSSTDRDIDPSNTDAFNALMPAKI